MKKKRFRIRGRCKHWT